MFERVGVPNAAGGRMWLSYTHANVNDNSYRLKKKKIKTGHSEVWHVIYHRLLGFKIYYEKYVCCNFRLGFCTFLHYIPSARVKQIGTYRMPIPVRSEKWYIMCKFVQGKKKLLILFHTIIVFCYHIPITYSIWIR